MKKTLLSAIILGLLWVAPAMAQTYAIDTLTINNVRAVFNSTGINFSSQYNSFYEVPKGSGQKTISCNTLWLAGMDVNSQWKMAGGIASSAGKDYYPGPLSTNGTASIDSATMANWNWVWKVTKAEIDYHIIHHADAGYICPPHILNWPAHGNPAVNQAQWLAPFWDVNGDQNYNPAQGDYPLIRGDEAVYFIFNDKGGLHNATNSQAIGIEIHAMAYAFHCPSDSALNNTVFINYRIINRSTYRLTNTMLGVYAGLHSNNDHNDLTRSDVKRGSFYTYSGNNTDPVFGDLFPAQALTILSGPYIDPDGIDNPRYDTLNPSLNCNEAINGQNFGDGNVDNERYGMTGFVNFTDTSSLQAITEPSIGAEYINYLHNKWKDNQQTIYWGKGHPSAGGYGPPCQFMYPANSDPCEWGTSGVNPGSPYPSNYWTEEQAINTPGNRQGLGNMGPFTFEVGAEYYLDIALIYGIDYTQHNNLYGWQTVLNQRIDSIRKYFATDSTPCGSSISGIASHHNTYSPSITIYPNPTTTTLTIDGLSTTAKAEVYDISGKLLMSNTLLSHSLDISRLTTGLYFIKLTTAEGSVVRKFVKE